MTACPICQNASHREYLRARDHRTGDPFTLRQCDGCQFVFLHPIPPNLDRYYPTSYRRYGRFTQTLMARSQQFRARSWARLFLTPGRALEIGCGEGWMLRALQQRGWRVLGIERALAAAQHAASLNHIPMLAGDVTTLRPEPTFDLILLHHVLEHLPNPMTTLQQCAALLRPNGLLLIVVPNLDSWQFKFSRQHWFHLDVPRHLSHFTPATLSHALSRAELEIKSVRFTSWDQDPFGWMVSLLNRLGFPQTRWLHWLTGFQHALTPVNLLMGLLSPPLLILGFILAPISWLAQSGACLHIRASQSSLPPRKKMVPRVGVEPTTPGL